MKIYLTILSPTLVTLPAYWSSDKLRTSIKSESS